MQALFFATLFVLLVITPFSAAQEEEEPVVVSDSILEALANGTVEDLTALIQGGADVNALSTDGLFPVIVAARNNDFEKLSVLVDAGADLNVQEGDGWTALMFAAAHVCRTREKVLFF